LTWNHGFKYRRFALRAMMPVIIQYLPAKTVVHRCARALLNYNVTHYRSAYRQCIYAHITALSSDFFHWLNFAELLVSQKQTFG